MLSNQIRLDGGKSSAISLSRFSEPWQAIAEFVFRWSKKQSQMMTLLSDLLPPVDIRRVLNISHFSFVFLSESCSSCSSVFSSLRIQDQEKKGRRFRRTIEARRGRKRQGETGRGRERQGEKRRRPEKWRRRIRIVIILGRRRRAKIVTSKTRGRFELMHCQLATSVNEIVCDVESSRETTKMTIKCACASKRRKRRFEAGWQTWWFSE